MKLSEFYLNDRIRLDYKVQGCYPTKGMFGTVIGILKPCYPLSGRVVVLLDEGVRWNRLSPFFPNRIFSDGVKEINANFFSFVDLDRIEPLPNLRGRYILISNYKKCSPGILPYDPNQQQVDDDTI